MKERNMKYHPIKLTNQTVLITGATAGIGEACAWRFANEGCKLILVGRREDRLIRLQNELKTEYVGLQVHIESLSVSDMDKVKSLPERLPDEYKKVDILVNNAGLALGVNAVDDTNIEDAQTMMDTNVMGIVAMCAAFIPGMKERGHGHVINMGSIAGHVPYPNGSVYGASKYAVKCFTHAARYDLVGTPIRVTHMSPGMVGSTEFSNVRLRDDAKAASVYENVKPLEPEDVADCVIYAATRPAHVQIAEMITLATNQASPRDVARVGLGLGR
jgi:3-hydroxy acid dehydrogenase / malonic semialdehyde reductase